MSQKVTKDLCQYFEEDLVYRLTFGGSLRVGVVVESKENSDDSDDDDFDESEKKNKLEPGFVKVAWYPKGKTQVVPEKKVGMFDRSLLCGDVVKRSNVEGGQRGLICQARVDLVCKIIGTKQVVIGAQSNDISGINLSEDMLFYFRDWVGIIEEIQHNVFLSLPDGSVARMSESDLFKFKDITSEKARNSEFEDSSPYVGQQVVVPSYAIKNLDFVSIKNNGFKPVDRDVVLLVTQIQVTKVQAHWLCCLSIPNSMIVEEANNVFSMKPPNTVITDDALNEIVQLDYFNKANIEMADCGVYVLKETDRILSYGQWGLEAANDLRKIKLGLDSDAIYVNGCEDNSEFIDVSSDEEEDMRISSCCIKRSLKSDRSIRRIREKYLKPSKNRNFSKKPIPFCPGTQVPIEVIVTKTFVDIMWQDGSIERECPSTNFYPVHHLDGHDYFPGDFVVKSNREFSHNLYGVIQSVDHSERTAKVKWLEVANNQQPHFVSEQEVSVYDIEDHPDFNFRPASCVARLPGPDNDKLTSAARAGQVVALKTSGTIECVWADGSRSEVNPQELYLIGDYDDDDLWADEDDDSDSDEDDFNDDFSARSREPKTPPSTALKRPSSSSTPKLKESDRELIDRLRKYVNGLEDWFIQFPTLNNQNAHVVVRKLTLLLGALEAIDSQMSTSLTSLKDLQTLIESVRLPESISGRTAHINRKLSKLIKSILKTKSGMDSPEAEETEQMVCEGAASEVDSSPISTKTRHSLEILQKLKTQLFAVCPEIEPEERVVENASDSNVSFQHVDHVPDTHKFKLSIFQTSNPRLFITRVRREIDLLQSSLPKDIIVKGFEDRMDLFSVLIKGPSGTPYEDGLFLFDVQLPAGYPNVPPLVNYIPFCRDRLNPNLYECGKVCVSLLGTWSGKGSEVWSPAESTLLQLFISIQGLILVPEPYFNEAGFTRQKGTTTGDENSRLYNEMAVVKVVESMTRMASSPPEPFREEIIHHVKSTSSSFITRLESWIRISKNQKAAGDIHLDFPLLPASKGFCLSLGPALESFRSVVSSMK